MPFSINYFFLSSITQTLLSFLFLFLFLSLPKVSASLSTIFSTKHFLQKEEGTYLSLLASAMEDDWDLHAVVRGCCNTTTTTTSTTTNSGSGGVVGGGSSFRSDFGSNQQLCFSASASPAFGIEQTSSNNHPPLFSLPDPFESRNNNGIIGDLHELYKPFFPKSQSIFAPTQPTPIQISTPVSSFTISKNPTPHQLKQHQSHQQLKQSITSSSANSLTHRSKRRKNQLKKICQVPAEALSSDVWAWRKYGQKPIKGSPYPRGYYRCSSSKGCLARKQVERNRSDPGMFLVTYTAEHNHPAPTHRNSLAGSTRQKSLTPQSATGDDSNEPSPPKPTCSSPATSLEDELLAQSTTAESREEDKDLMEDDDEVELGDLSEMEVNDDFFAGLEGLTGDPVTGDRFSDNFPANFGLPWHANSNAATTAAGSL